MFLFSWGRQRQDVSRTKRNTETEKKGFLLQGMAEFKRLSPHALRQRIVLRTAKRNSTTVRTEDKDRKEF
jgi:hypothetical protein